MGFPEPSPNPACLYATAHTINDAVKVCRAYHRSVIDINTGKVVKRPPLGAVMRMKQAGLELYETACELEDLGHQG